MIEPVGLAPRDAAMWWSAPSADPAARRALAGSGPWLRAVMACSPTLGLLPAVGAMANHSAAFLVLLLAIIAALHGALLSAWKRGEPRSVAWLEAVVPLATLLLLADSLLTGHTKWPLEWLAVYLYVPVLAHLYRRTAVLPMALFAVGFVAAATEMTQRTSGTPNATLIANALMPPLLYLLLAADPERERRARAEIAAYQEALERARAEEIRLALAREVHDGIGAHLTAAAMQAEVAVDTVMDEPLRARAALSRLRKRITQAAEELSLLSEKRQDTTWGALIDELRIVGEGLAQPCHWTFEARCQQPDAAVTGALRLAFRRALQEGIANAVRHGRARRIDVTLNIGTAEASLQILDDGVGLSGSSEGFGRRSIRSRLQAVGGGAEWSSGASGGTCLRLHVPTAVEPARVAA